MDRVSIDDVSFHTNKQVMTPNWEGALSFFTRAAELFSQTYDGKDEVREGVFWVMMMLISTNLPFPPRT